MTKVNDRPRAGETAWCPMCGWSVIQDVKVYPDGPVMAECALCGTNMCQDGTVIRKLPKDAAKLRDMIQSFLSMIHDGRDFKMDLAYIEAEELRLPYTWERTHEEDARALASAVDLLQAVLSATSEQEDNHE